ncbi:hypothetical protein, partial [Nostoc sp.]
GQTHLNIDEPGFESNSARSLSDIPFSKLNIGFFSNDNHYEWELEAAVGCLNFHGQFSTLLA